MGRGRSGGSPEIWRDGEGTATRTRREAAVAGTSKCAAAGEGVVVEEGLGVGTEGGIEEEEMEAPRGGDCVDRVHGGRRARGWKDGPLARGARGPGGR